jgi:hypothetical protein
VNPTTGAVYPSIEEGIAAGEKPDDLIYVEGREEKINELIALAQKADKQRHEEKRQAAKKRRVAAEAARKKNRRKK